MPHCSSSLATVGGEAAHRQGLGSSLSPPVLPTSMQPEHHVQEAESQGAMAQDHPQVSRLY
jgi:hypothetical protein